MSECIFAIDNGEELEPLGTRFELTTFEDLVDRISKIENKGLKIKDWGSLKPANLFIVTFEYRHK